MKKGIKPTGYVVIDYLRCKHPEAENTVEIKRLFDGDVEQASIMIGSIFVSQRSVIKPSSLAYDTVLFKDRENTNNRFEKKLSTIGSSYHEELDEEKLKKELSDEILNLINVFEL